MYLAAMFFFSACSKWATNVTPEIEGVWKSEIGPPNCGSGFTIDENSNGYYYPESVGLQYEGRAKIKDQVLYIGDFQMLTIHEIKDSVGTIPNLDSTLCYTELNISFNGILRQSNGKLWYRL